MAVGRRRRSRCCADYSSASSRSPPSSWCWARSSSRSASPPASHWRRRRRWRSRAAHLRSLSRRPSRVDSDGSWRGGEGRMSEHGFTAAELRALRTLGSPYGVQRALDAMPYHHAGSAWSPRRVLREGTAHCLEGAIFAAAALRVLGFPPLLLDLEAVQDTDHVLAVYQVRGHWGARSEERRV